MKWILIFDTKQSQYASVFLKIRLPRYDKGNKFCWMAIVEASTAERAWEIVFTVCPDYYDRGVRSLERAESIMPRREGPSGEKLEHDIQSIARHLGYEL